MEVFILTPPFLPSAAPRGCWEQILEDLRRGVSSRLSLASDLAGEASCTGVLHIFMMKLAGKVESAITPSDGGF